MKVIGVRWGRTRGKGSAGRRRKAELGAKEARRLMQLAACLALFLAVFIGRGVFPNQTAAAGEELLSAIRQSIDFKGAFLHLGEALNGEKPIGDAVSDFCVAVFGFGEVEEKQTLEGVESLLDMECAFLEQSPTGKEMAARRLWLPVREESGQEEKKEPEKVEDTILPVGAVVETISYEGEPLPEDTTMDHLSLGDLNYVTPVFGTVTSEFGYREHPVYEETKFHHGVDIAADKGTEIQAFADGTVEFVGESTTYGLYVQLSHASGIKTFYAHCGDISVNKGDAVTAGQTIATVGDTGNATGAHLHFQLSLDGTELNPTYYIQTS